MIFALVGAFWLVLVITFFIGALASMVNKRLPIRYQFKYPYFFAVVGVGLAYASLIGLVVRSNIGDWINGYYVAAILIVSVFFYAYGHVKKWNLLPIRKALLGLVFVLACLVTYVAVIALPVLLANLFK
jgi:hypothetical protein